MLTPHTVSKNAQSKSVVTGSSVISWVHDLFKSIDIRESDSTKTKELKREMFAVYEKRFGHYRCKVTFHLMAACFDPRHSKNLVEKYGVEKDVVDEAWMEIFEDGERLLFPQAEETAESEGGSIVDSADDFVLDLQADNFEAEDKKRLGDYLKRVRTVLEVWPDMEEDSDPLEFWQQKEIKTKKGRVILAEDVFSFVKPVAAMFLACPAGASPSECAFSGTGMILGDHRQRLRPENLEASLVVGDYISSEYYDWETFVRQIQREMTILDRALKKKEEARKKEEEERAILEKQKREEAERSKRRQEEQESDDWLDEDDFILV